MWGHSFATDASCGHTFCIRIDKVLTPASLPLPPSLSHTNLRSAPPHFHFTLGPPSRSTLTRNTRGKNKTKKCCNIAASILLLCSTLATLPQSLPIPQLHHSVFHNLIYYRLLSHESVEQLITYTERKGARRRRLRLTSDFFPHSSALVSQWCVRKKSENRNTVLLNRWHAHNSIRTNNFVLFLCFFLSFPFRHFCFFVSVSFRRRRFTYVALHTIDHRSHQGNLVFPPFLFFFFILRPFLISKIGKIVLYRLFVRFFNLFFWRDHAFDDNMGPKSKNDAADSRWRKRNPTWPIRVTKCWHLAHLF